MESWRSELQRVPGGTDELAEDGDVRTIHADTAGIDGEAETFGEIEVRWRSDRATGRGSGR